MLFRSIRRNNMAKAALETALWDLYAKSYSQPLAKILGGTRPLIASGVVVATDSTKNALQQIEQYLEEVISGLK